MAVFKCKMCGASLNINDDSRVVTCEYCDTQQTLPKLDDDRRASLYDRANHFRRNNDFDKAMGIYEQILNEDNTDAEAYWSLVLCRYGIEYVEDPVTHKRIHTVNRMQYTSVLADQDYKAALEYANGYQRSIYMEEAESIDRIQKGILAISQKEDPFDIFICYKETDSAGKRTHDSVLAQDLYYQLKQEGFKVFFARITLEGKLGTAYEPYIFAALNSAKVMVVIGTKPEHFNAVWVKNEWSRYLTMIRNGDKKMLIPAYKDMDPYDMPEEFSHLQAQDMSKLGFMQDLIRGIKKIVKADEPKPAAAAQVSSASHEIAPLLRRISMFLEDRDWENANNYCERVLDIAPECGEAYVMKLMARVQAPNEAALGNGTTPLEQYQPYKNAVRFSDAATADRLRKYNDTIKERVAKIEEERARRAREEQERQDREARRVQRIADLRNQRQALIDQYNAYDNRRQALQAAVAGKERELRAFPNMIVVRLFALLILGVAFFNFIAMIGAMTDDAAMGIFLLGFLVYFIFFGIFAKVCKRSIGLMFLNIPTLGIFGVVFLIIMFFKSFFSKKNTIRNELRQLQEGIPECEIHMSELLKQITEIESELHIRGD